MKKQKKRPTLIRYFVIILMITFAIPASFLFVVAMLGADLQRMFILNVVSILLLVSLLIYLGLFIMSLYEVKNLITKALNKSEQGDYTTRILITDDMPEEIVLILSGFNELMKSSEKLIYQTRKAIVEQKNAEIAALEAQIDPHFLYNTLDTINWKAIEHEDYEVSNMVGALADILRYTIKNQNEECTIEKEIYWLEQYIFFQRAKLGKELEIVYDVPDELKKYKIHKLLLQPFVENSIKHGFPKAEHPCVLKIKMREAGEQIHIIIKDNGIGMDSKLVEHINTGQVEMKNRLGIANVCRRLNLYYGDDANLFFESEIDKYTEVHLFIPKRSILNNDKYSDS